MKTFLRWCATGAMLLSCALHAGQENSSPARSLQPANELARAAEATYVKFNRESEERREKGGEIEIPSKYWAEPIKALRPVKVYLHRVNVVVVQRFQNNVEEGKYIYLSISSYLPHSGDDGFEFTPNPMQGNRYQLHEVLDFKRIRGKQEPNLP